MVAWCTLFNVVNFYSFIGLYMVLEGLIMLEALFFSVLYWLI